MKKLVAVVGLMAVLMSGVVARAEGFREKVGLQLYSLREQFKADGVPATLDKVKALGFKYVELAGTYGMKPEDLLAELKKRGLVAVAGHSGYDQWKKDPAAAAREAKALGLKYVGCAWAGHKPPLDEKQTREIAAVFNKAGEATAKEGIQFFYHNHGFEFLPYGDGTLFDLLVKETDAKLVKFELDVLWTFLPGVDPAKLIAKYPDRFALVHLKDLKKGVAVNNHTGKTDKTNDVALGSGQVNWSTFVAAAEKAGVKYYFIEDESPTVLEQLPQSLKFLDTFKK